MAHLSGKTKTTREGSDEMEFTLIKPSRFNLFGGIFGMIFEIKHQKVIRDNLELQRKFEYEQALKEWRNRKDHEGEEGLCD
jgi:hypothetical protein